MSDSLNQEELLKATVKLVSSYLSNHKVELEKLEEVFYTVHQILSDVNKNPTHLRNRSPLVPAVPIEESVSHDYIVCLEDGKRLQMLKRHLSTVYNMTIDQYKERWDLPSDYPVVSPSYAKRRSEIAKNTGLGITGRRKRKLKVLYGEDANKSQAAVIAGRKKDI